MRNTPCLTTLETSRPQGCCNSGSADSRAFSTHGTTPSSRYHVRFPHSMSPIQHFRGLQSPTPPFRSDARPREPTNPRLACLDVVRNAETRFVGTHAHTFQQFTSRIIVSKSNGEIAPLASTYRVPSLRSIRSQNSSPQMRHVHTFDCHGESSSSSRPLWLHAPPDISSQCQPLQHE